MTTLIDLVTEAQDLFARHCLAGALEIHLSRAQAVDAQQSIEVAKRVIDAALDPDPDAPLRPGSRLFAVIAGVRVYVRED